MTPLRATRREWTGLAVIALPCLVDAMHLTMLNLAALLAAHILRGPLPMAAAAPASP